MRNVWFLKKGPWQNSAVIESGSFAEMESQNRWVFFMFFLSTEVIQKVWEVTCTNGLQRKKHFIFMTRQRGGDSTS